MPDFEITQIIGNKVLLRYGALSFYVYIDLEDGRQVVSKPRSVYIDKPEFYALRKLVLDEYNANLLVESMDNGSNN